MSKADAFLSLARARWKQAEEADQPQKERELADLKFYAGEQWPDAIVAARAGQGPNPISGMPAVPARPCLTINKVREPVRQVLNQERQADMGIELVPADDFAGLLQGRTIDHTEIELREGLIRRIQRQSHAADARTWAFSRAVIAGRGYYGVLTKWVPGTFDQEIGLQRFYNQSAVLLDPTHEQPDGSDAGWGFVGVDLPMDEYTAEFGTVPATGRANRVSAASDAEWRTLGDDAPTWFHADGETKSVRVVDYYYTVRTPVTLVQGTDGQTYETSTLPPGVAVATDEDGQPITRRDSRTTVKWAKIDGCQVLDETDWPGQFIPIVKVTGDELQPYDRQRRSEGMVRAARDAQFGFNAMVSKEVELIGLTPLPPLFVEEGSIEGYEDWYQAANTRTLPYLPYKRTNLDGQPANPPSTVMRQAQIGDVVVAVREFDQAIKSTTGIPDPTLGNVDPALKSGRAIKALLDQAQRGTSNYLDNLRRSIGYEAQILNDLLEPIYGRRPGRLLRLVNSEGEVEAALVNQPFVRHEGQVRPVGPPGQPGQPGQPPQGPQGQPGMPGPPPQGQPAPLHLTLTPGVTFNIAVKVSKSFDTRREQEAAQWGDLIAAQPEAMGVIGDLFFKAQDGPGAQEAADRFKMMLAPPIQAKLQQQSPLPPQVQAQMAQMQQQMGEMHQIIQQKQVEQQGQVEKARVTAEASLEQTKLEIASREKIALINQLGSLTATQAKVDAEDARTFVDAMESRMSQSLDLHLRKLDHAHALQAQHHTQAHEVGLAQLAQDAMGGAMGAAPEPLAMDAPVASAQGDGAGV